MTQGLLIDTCALIWSAALANGDAAGALDEALAAARTKGAPVCVSPITAWEIGMLSAKGRLPMPMTPKAWIDRVMALAGLEWAKMPADVLLASSFLPGDLHGDPADRIIVATAREYGMRLVTRDRKILDYAAKGHVMALEC